MNSSSNDDPKVVRVTKKGQATIPKELREKFNIETPGEILIYENGENIIIEPMPTASDLHGIHAPKHESGEITERLRAIREEEEEQEKTRNSRVRPREDE